MTMMQAGNRKVFSPEGWNDARRELPDEGVPVETKVSWNRHSHTLTWQGGRWWVIVGVAYVTHKPEHWRYKDVM